MKPLISIIVPIYNVEKYLDKCINSIINQTYENLEIILINDGSTDNCGIICDKYAEVDKRIKVIHKKNGGLSDTRNVGIEIAKGDYIGFIDSDDWIERDMYNILLTVSLREDADIVECKFINSYNRDNIYDGYSSKQIKVFDKEEAIKSHIYGDGLYRAVWNKIYKKNLFEDLRFPKGKTAEDLYITYKLFYKANKTVYIDYVGYYYFIRSNSIMGTSNINLIISIFEGMQEQHEFICDKIPELKRRIDKLYMNCLLKTYSYLEYSKEYGVDEYKKIVDKEIKRNDIESSGATAVLVNLFSISPKITSILIKSINNRKR